MSEGSDGSIAMGLGLWVPDEAREEFTSARGGDYDYETAMLCRKVLKGIDSRLDIIWVKQGAVSFPIGARWYFVRKTGDGMHSAFWVIQTPDGGYCPPTQQHIEALQARDSVAHPDVWRRMRRERQRTREDAAKAKAEKSREFREKLEERLRFNNDVQVPVSEADKLKLAA